MKDTHVFDWSLDSADYESRILEIIGVIRPEWNTEAVTCHKFTVGLTNTLVGVCHAGSQQSQILFRIYGDGTDLFIDRDAEKRIMQLMYRAGRACPLMATFTNGLVYGYMPGSTVNTATVRAPEVFPLIAAEMATVHRIRPDDYTGDEPVSLWPSLDRMMKNAPTEFADPEEQKRFSCQLRSPAELREELRQLRVQLDALDSPVVLCHNDLLLENVLLAPDRCRVRFIDFEYGGFNHQAYDIANHFNEFPGTESVDYSLLPNREFQLRWLRCYLEAYLSTEPGPAPRLRQPAVQPTEQQVNALYMQVNKFALLSHYYWGFWALVQTRFSKIDFDYLEYAIVRFNEYDRKRKELADLEQNS